MKLVDLSQVERMIYVIRGHKVMLDWDLAQLYGVDVKRLNEQVKRNMSRFPEDFMFQLTSEERDFLRSQFATFNEDDPIGARKYMPYAFTENGVAMLSSVLKSPQAVQVNIAIMRIFTRLRSFLLLESELRREMDDMKDGQEQLFGVVFERLDGIEESLKPRLPANRKRIGLKSR
jgi:hypothetical protein